jgi:Tfp pilus assembly protein PilO
MKEVFSVLNDKERKQLYLLSLLLVLALAFLFLVSLGQRRAYHRLAGQIETKAKSLAEAEEKLAAASTEWANWEQAYKDMAELKERYFYKEADGVNSLRVDLQKILADSGISAGRIRYEYVDRAREREKIVVMTFDFTGSYLILKRFLETVEKFPKFLLLERVKFVRVSNEGNLLELGITLAGYYESF